MLDIYVTCDVCGETRSVPTDAKIAAITFLEDEPEDTLIEFDTFVCDKCQRVDEVGAA